jgi:hypothetical protein
MFITILSVLFSYLYEIHCFAKGGDNQRKNSSSGDNNILIKTRQDEKESDQKNRWRVEFDYCIICLSGLLRHTTGFWSGCIY